MGSTFGLLFVFFFFFFFSRKIGFKTNTFLKLKLMGTNLVLDSYSWVMDS